MSKSVVLVTMAAALALAVAPPNAVWAADWEAELNDTALFEHDCEVAFLSQVAERELDGKHVIIAKVHCEDKRTFDAYRGDDFEAFQLSPCEDPKIRTC